MEQKKEREVMNIKKFTELVVNESSANILDEYRDDINGINSKYKELFTKRITDIMNTWLEYHDHIEDNEIGEGFGEYNFSSRGHYDSPIILGNGAIINTIYYSPERGWVLTGKVRDKYDRAKSITYAVSELSTYDLSIVLDSMLIRGDIVKYYDTKNVLRKLNEKRNYIKRYSDLVINESVTVVPPIIDEYWGKLSELTNKYKKQFIASISLLLNKWLESDKTRNEFELMSEYEYIGLEIGTVIMFTPGNDEWFVIGYRGDITNTFEYPLSDLSVDDLADILTSLSNIKDISNNLNVDILKKLNK